MNIDGALALLHQKLDPVKGDWTIIGTASLYLAGYPVSPNDIDVLCDAVKAKEIEACLADYRVDTKVVPNDKFRSRFSQYNLYGFKVEVMGDLEVNTADGWVLLRDSIPTTEVALLDNRTFKIPTRERQVAIYALFDRDKDVPILNMLLSNYEKLR